MRKQMPALGAVTAIALTAAMVWQSRSGRVAMTLRLVPVALLLGTSSALAFDTSKLIQFGTLPFDDLTPVIAKSARLQQEINQALSEGNKEHRVVCLGMRFPGPWKNLGGFECHPTPVISAPNGCKSMPPFVLLTAMAEPLRRSRPRR